MTSQSRDLTGSCHLRELDICAASLFVFVQSPDGMATSDQEINKQCNHIQDADQCFKNFTRRCMTPIQRQIVNFGANSTLQVAAEYCQKSSTFRSNYLKHSKCMNQVQKKEQKGCMRDLQVALEILSSSQTQFEGNKRLAFGCCAFKRFESCFGVHLEKRCGKDAMGFVQSTFNRITSRLPEMVCRTYRADSTECRLILPKPGSIPRGAKSNSVISRLMSAYSGLQ